MEINSVKFNKDELYAFVLLYVANADLEIDSNETDMIRKHIKKKKFHEIEMIFEKCNDNDCLQIIMNHKSKYFSSTADKDKLIKEITSLIEIDDKKTEMEAAVLMGLKRLL